MRGEYFLGQANLFMVVCVCAALWARLAQRVLVASLLLALAFAIKPMLLVVVGFLLWKREFKFALTSVCAAVILLLAPFLWLGTRAFNDLLVIWHFYSSQYLSFDENIAPRGVLERLFTANPVVPPIADIPALASLLWLASASLVLLFAVSVIAPRPLLRSNRSLLEVGLMISAVLLVSPLTEPAYLLFLIVPWISMLNYLQSADWRRSSWWWTALTLLSLWSLEFFPRALGPIWQRMDAVPHIGAIASAISPSLVVLFGTFVLQLHVLARASGNSTVLAVRRFVLDFPWLARYWVGDLRDAFKASIQRSGHLTQPAE